MAETIFWEYKLESDMLCLGERIKKGTFRPSLKTIPSTQISGALRYALGREDIWAIGYLEEWNVEYLVQAPRDMVTGVSKVPLTVEVLTDVKGKVFIKGKGGEEPPFRKLRLLLGALRSKGLGECCLTYRRLAKLEHKEGELRSRLPEAEKGEVGIKEVLKPIYGYLFHPHKDPSEVYTISGTYIRALLEGSLVKGYSFIVK